MALKDHWNHFGGKNLKGTLARGAFKPLMSHLRYFNYLKQAIKSMKNSLSDHILSMFTQSLLSDTFLFKYGLKQIYFISFSTDLC